MLVRLILLSVFILSAGFAMGQSFITSNATGTIQMEARISWGGDYMQNALVERRTLTTVARSNALSDPFINLSELELRTDHSVVVPSGGKSFYLVPMAERRDIFKLSPGDRLAFICGCGDWPVEGNTECSVTTESSTYGKAATYCRDAACGGVCQSFIHVYSSTGDLKYESFSGGLLIQAENLQSASVDR
jgi:hypothetical protein